MHNYIHNLLVHIQTSGADWCRGRWLVNLHAANLTLSATPLTRILDQPSELANIILTKCSKG